MKSNKEYKIILGFILVLISLFCFLFYLPESRRLNEKDNTLKKNYKVARGVLVSFETGFTGGHGDFLYQFCVDSILYTNTISLKYFNNLEDKKGDTISIAYELNDVEHNMPMYILFINDSIGNKYKYEFE